MRKNTAIAIISGVIILFIIGILLSRSTSQNNVVGNGSKMQSMNHAVQNADAQTFSKLLGKEAPDFTLESVDGKQVNVKQLRSKNVVLFFTEGLMCYPACWNQIAAFTKGTAFNNTDTTTLMITVDKKEDWQQAIDEMPELAKAIVLFDTDKSVSKTYGVLTLDSSMHKGDFPGHTYVIIDKTGIVQFTKDDPQMGIRNDDIKKELEKLK